MHLDRRLGAGTGGDVGFTLDGSHAELIAVPESALARRPAALDHAQTASPGVPFEVGWMGLGIMPGYKRARTLRSSACLVGLAA